MTQFCLSMDLTIIFFCLGITNIFTHSNPFSEHKKIEQLTEKQFQGAVRHVPTLLAK